MNRNLRPSFGTSFVCAIALTLGLSIAGSQAVAQSARNIDIVQARGADQSVRYRELAKYGPWDDRNYNLTAADLKLLVPNETELHPGIPAFFRVELRREWPHLMRTGVVQYPRAALQLFRIRYGGLMQNGVIENDRRELAKAAPDVTVKGEIQLNQVLGANESTVEINPSNPLQVIAGANNAGGQEMYYSTDGGLNWTIQGVLPNTCCDPTVDWSSDGTVAYAAALSGAIGVSAWRSFDGGQTWVDRVNLTNSGSDKEFLHVDKFLRRVQQPADIMLKSADGSVYVAWTDTVDPETGNPALNHTRVNVAYSRDGGATWNQSTPHSLADMMTVDRWNQWLSVDENGTVHVRYYDTRNSLGRTGVDFYYTYSTDGGVSWETAQRISSQTSANLTDGQEFGDYNGISVVGAKGIPTRTDNRDGPPNMKDVYAAEFSNDTGAPGFALSGGPLDQEVCAAGDLADISVSVAALQAFTNPVTLSYSGLPAGSSGGFSVNPVTPGNSTLAQVFIGPVATGNYSFDIIGTALDADDRSLKVSVAAFDGAPAATSLPDAQRGTVGLRR